MKENTVIKTRKCISCDGTKMVPELRKFTSMETTIMYVCPGCDATVEFKSLGQAGLLLSVGLMGLVFISAILFSDKTFGSDTDYLIYTIVVLLVLYVLVSPLLPYWIHPITGETQITDPGLDFASVDFIDDFSDVLQRAIIKFERHGFWRGFLTPIVFIAVMLGIATAIGIVNYYLF